MVHARIIKQTATLVIFTVITTLPWFVRRKYAKALSQATISTDRHTISIVIFLLTALLLYAAPQSSVGAIQGQILRTGTDEAIRDVRVTLQQVAPANSNATRIPPRTAVSDSDGIGARTARDDEIARISAGRKVTRRCTGIERHARRAPAGQGQRLSAGERACGERVRAAARLDYDTASAVDEKTDGGLGRVQVDSLRGVDRGDIEVRNIV